MTKRKWNNFRKRGLALFLALIMCLGMLPTAAFAAGEETITCPTCNGARVVTEPCPDCDGNGKVSVTSECPDCEEPQVCDVCHGTHEVETTKPCPDCLNAEEPVECETCGGNGKVTGEVIVICEACGGTGEVVDPETGESADCEACEGTGKTTEEGLVSCEACGGSGKTETPECPTCGGTKQVKDTEPCAACADAEEPPVCPTCGGTREVTTTEDCATCEGAGTVERTCPECNGTGEVTVKREEPQVPAEVQDFLDAVDALPDASTVTKDNAVEIGEQADAILASYTALSTEYQAREDVIAAKANVDSVQAAAEAALDNSGEDEIPAEVQAFLDAVAKLPAIDTVTPENAEEIGEQVNAVLDMWEALVDAGLGEREDVQNALNDTVYPLFKAVTSGGSMYHDLDGTGVESDPILIKSAQDLQTVASWINSTGSGGNAARIPGTQVIANQAYYQLDADIDLADLDAEYWTPIGDKATSSNYCFKGVFIGKGHTISNLKINTTRSYQGLFGYFTGEICDLTILNSDVLSTGTTGYVGALIGNMEGGRVCNVHVKDVNVSLKYFVRTRKTL